MNLAECIPTDKHDAAAVRRAEAFGYPGINPILPELLQWLQDINWPVASKVASLLAKAGPEIAQPIRDVLNSDDDVWKYFVLQDLAGHLDTAARGPIRTDIVRIAESPTKGEQAEEVDLEASRLLAVWAYQSG
jgi:HEAT repeat protein